MNSGPRWAGDIKKIIFIFKMRQKRVTKLGQFTKLGHFSFFKLSKLCSHFLSSFENGNNFFLYPQQSPAHSGPEFIDQSIFPKKIDDFVYFQQQQKNAKLKRREGSFQLFKLSKLFTIFCQVLKIEIFFLISLAIPCPLRPGIY